MQDNHPNQVLTDLTADAPTSSTQKAASVSRTSTCPHAATSVLADAHSDSSRVPASLGNKLQAPGSGVEALLAGQTETTPQKGPPAAACATDFPVEEFSAGAQDTSVQLPTAPQTDPPTDRQTCQAPASMSSTSVTAKTMSSRAAEGGKPAVEAPVSLELSSQADDLAQAPAGPDVSPALAHGKAQTSFNDAALPAGLDFSSPQPTEPTSASKDVQMAPETGFGAHSTAVPSLAVATNGLLLEAPAIAAAALKSGTAVSTNPNGSIAQPLPAAEAAKEAAFQEAAVPANALKSTGTTVGELQRCPSSMLLAPCSGAQKVAPATVPAASSLQDPVGPPSPGGPTLKQAAPRHPAVHPDAHAAVPNSNSPASAHSPHDSWSLRQAAGLDPGLAREAATAQASAPLLDQAGAQVGASLGTSFREPASVTLPCQAGMQGAAPMDTVVSHQASGPCSHEEAHPAATSLSVATTEKLAAATQPNQASDPAVDPAGDPATHPLHAQVFAPPGAGAESTDANPSIIAVRAVGSDAHVPAAEQRLAAGEPAGQQSTAMAPAGASASAVATTVAPAMAPAVKSQPRRATRFRQSAEAAPEAAAPAACLTTTTTSENGRGAELVGQRIEVWWSGEKKYLPGVIKAFSPSKVNFIQGLLSLSLVQTAQ